MGLACVDGVGVGAGVWARRGPKSRSAGRVSRRLFGSAGAGDPGRNIEFARQELSSSAAGDAATWNFDFQTMTPLSGPMTWGVSASAPYPYLTHTHTQLPHTHTQLLDAAAATQSTDVSATHTQLPDAANAHTQLPDAATHTQLPNAATHTQLPNAATHTQLPNDTTHTQLPNDTTHTQLPTNNNAATPGSEIISTSSVNTSSHTTCLTTPPRCVSPTTTTSSKPVKRLQQRVNPAKVQTRKITDFFTEVRTTPRAKMQLKTELLDTTTAPSHLATAPHLTTRGTDLRREEADGQ